MGFKERIRLHTCIEKMTSWEWMWGFILEPVDFEGGRIGEFKIRLSIMWK